MMTIFQSILLVSTIFAQRCSKPMIRKEILNLSEREFNDYVDTVQELNRKGILERYTRIHYKASPNIHGHPSFLPWHRQYLKNFELELQKINPTVTLPYWDWLKDFEAPHLSPVLSAKYLGGEGHKKDNYCVLNGKFNNFIVQYPQHHCLRRQFSNLNGTIPSFSNPKIIEQFKSNPSFGNFSYSFEVVHGYVHTGIGGWEGDMTPHYSPNDPLFYLHHAFIDKIWFDWQVKHGHNTQGGRVQYNGDNYGIKVNQNDVLYPFKNDVKSTFFIAAPQLCYRYDTDNSDSYESLFIGKLGTSNKGMDRPMSDLDKQFMKKNNINLNKAKNILDDAKEKIHKMIVENSWPVTAFFNPITKLFGVDMKDIISKVSINHLNHYVKILKKTFPKFA